MRWWCVLGLVLVAGSVGAQEKPGGLCPGVLLSYSCGNGVCEGGLGESLSSCPQDCEAAALTSYNRVKRCPEVEEVVVPENAEQAQQAMATALLNGQRLKFVGSRHSISGALCGDGVVIASEALRTIHGIEEFEGQTTVRVDAGVKLVELTEWLHDRGWSLGYALMGYNGVSLAGAIGTGSHGSSPKHSAVLSSKVVFLDVIGADGQLQSYSAGTTDPDVWKSLTTHAGMLGFVVNLRLRLEPQFKLKVKVTYHNESSLFDEGGALEEVRECDYGQINWWPRTGKYFKTCGKVTTKSVHRGAQNVLLDPFTFKGSAPLARNLFQVAACDRGIAKTIEAVRYADFVLNPPFEKNVWWWFDPIRSNKVKGYSHRMMSSYFDSEGDGIFNVDWEVAVPQQFSEQALIAVREILHRYGVSLFEVGVFLRFAPSESTSWLANSATGGPFREGEIAMYIELPVPDPVAFGENWMAWYEAPYREVMTTLIQDFGGRAHLGKNKDWVFEFETEQDAYGENLLRFQAAVSELDPTGVFSNDWSFALGLSR